MDPIFRDDAGLIRDVQAGTYRFVIEQGGADNIQIQHIDLILHSGGGKADTHAQLIELSLIAVGFIGLVLSVQGGGGNPQNPNSQPPAPR